MKNAEALLGGLPVASVSAEPIEEFKVVCDFMRMYATLRFYQLALLASAGVAIDGSAAAGPRQPPAASMPAYCRMALRDDDHAAARNP